MIELIVISILVAIGRFTVHGVHQVVSWEDSYEALAHIWIGFVVGIAYFERNMRKISLWIVAILSALELAMFFR